MNAHVIENGVVVNTIVVDSLDYMPNLVEATEGAIGWLYSNGVFTNPNAEAEKQKLADTLRELRDSLLRKNVDSLNSFRLETMSEEERSAWAVYRQALLDVPQQSGFPTDVVWPKKPEF